MPSNRGLELCSTGITRVNEGTAPERSHQPKRTTRLLHLKPGHGRHKNIQEVRPSVNHLTIPEYHLSHNSLVPSRHHELYTGHTFGSCCITDTPIILLAGIYILFCSSQVLPRSAVPTRRQQVPHMDEIVCKNIKPSAEEKALVCFSSLISASTPG